MVVRDRCLGMRGLDFGVLRKFAALESKKTGGYAPFQIPLQTPSVVAVESNRV